MESLIIEAKNLSVSYLNHLALKNVNMKIYKNEVIALIGPSGCGKSTFLRTLNRMNDLIPEAKTTGEVFYKNQNILSKDIDICELRKEIGMVFQKPNPFPMSIYDNITFGPKIHGIKNKEKLKEILECSLKGAYIWDEVKDILGKNATSLSGGQQQRLCIARALSVKPEILLMDEPTSALDPISTSKIEELIIKLKEKYTVVIVTHNMGQAKRIADKTAFFFLGELVEFDVTEKIFNKPKDERTKNYVEGKFG